MSQWYYALEGRQAGPVDEEEFRRLAQLGVIRPETLIWRSGLSDWTPYSRVPDAPQPVVPWEGSEAEGPRCGYCGRVFGEQDLVPIGGRPACMECKPAALKALDEGAILPAYRQNRRLPVDPEALLAEVRARGYQVEIGALMGRAWEIYKARFWPCVGASTLIIILSQVAGMVPFLGMILSLVLTGPLFAGLYYYFLRLVRGESPPMQDIFAGFTSEFWRYMLTGIVLMLPMMVVLLVVVVPVMVMVGLMGFADGGGERVIWLVVVPVIGIALLTGLYFQVALMFALPLSIDLQLGPIQASLVSLKAVNMQLGWVMLLMVLTGLMVFAGFLALFVGIFFTLPIGWIVSMLLYEEIFSIRGARVVPQAGGALPEAGLDVAGP